ncbi:MAG: 1-deoxy-D-xylulose-5-phosphate synthase [Oscillospiraceae bacterium]|nr:1-deoxy-D-xylulose-5-phosphate synthase [Oscillospiraceae bacterium]
MRILPTVNSSADIKHLSEEELEELAKEIRLFLVDSLSRTGGHLASNLGVVELTLALHRVFDTKKDRIVFDVGHQSYVHKIITGRRDRFATLRQYGGLSGFPKPYESDDDAFIAGHASNAISVALGMAEARTLLQKDYDVVALLGDGALTGGLAFEGLAAAAVSKEPMVIVLNDNNMSIDRNDGGISNLLQEMRIRPGYIRFKRFYRDALASAPIIHDFNHQIKEWMKGKLLPSNMFSALGLNYIGPVDGHNLKELELVLQLAKDHHEPVIVHVLTKKGKGCSYTEAHPDIYHGVGPYNPKSGELVPSGRSFSDCFGESMCRLAAENRRVTAITAAMGLGTGLETYAKQFPHRYFDTGIAEGHATSLAAGMAKEGLLPVFAVYSTFLQRGFDMMIHDVSLQKLHVVFCLDRAGIVGGDGETHHGIFDISYLRTVPGMKILAPASFQELPAMLGYAVNEMEGPVAVRYPRGGECGYSGFAPGKETVLREGSDLTMVAYGTMIGEVLRAAEMLTAKGLQPEVIKLSELDGEEFPQVMQSLKKTGKLLAAEEVCAAGCIGEVLTAAAAREAIPVSARLLNLGCGILPQGKRELLMRDWGIDADGIVRAAEELNCGKMQA